MGSIATAAAYFVKGGLVMWPLLFCSIAVIAIAIERGLFYRATCSKKQFIEAYCEDMATHRIQEGKELAATATGACALILKQAPANATKNELEAYFQARAGLVIAQLRKRLNYLSLITTLAPLLGLLGTIIGMISAFSIFNLEAGAPIAITGGIGEALIATATGLCVTIVSLLVHAKFESSMDEAITDMEQCFNATIEAQVRGDH